MSLNGNLPSYLRMFVSYFLQQDVGKCKVKTPLVTMLLRQLIVDISVVCKIAFRFMCSCLLIFAAYLRVCYSVMM